MRPQGHGRRPAGAMDQPPFQLSGPTSSPMAGPWGLPAEGTVTTPDDYLDMDGALKDFLTALWDSPVPEPTVLEASAADPPPLEEPLADVDSGATAKPAGIWDAGLERGKEAVASAGGEAMPAGPFTRVDLLPLPSVGECGEEGARETLKDEAKGQGVGRGKKRRDIADPDTDPDSVDKPDRKNAKGEVKKKVAPKGCRQKRKVKVNELQREVDNLQALLGNLQLENTSLQGQNVILHKVLDMRAEQIRMLQVNNQCLWQAGEGDGTQVSQAPVMLSELRKGTVLHLTVDMLKEMQAAELMQYWQEYVTAISAALAEAEKDPDAEERVEKLVNECIMLCMRYAVLCPISLKVWTTSQYFGSEVEEVQLWMSFYPNLCLSDYQVQEIIKRRAALLQLLQEVIDERRVLAAMIRTTVASSTVVEKLGMAHIKANKTVIQLKENLRSEHKAILEFVHKMLKQILKPLQIAKIMVHACPRKPDLLAVASAVQQCVGTS